MPGRDDEYKIALSLTKGVAAPLVREMESRGISPEDFFSKETPELLRDLGLSGQRLFGRCDRDEALFRARKELDNMARHRIRFYFLLDDDYPSRLSEIHDAPVCLYQLGEAEIDVPHIISVVGTRRPSSYGLNFTKTLISDLSSYFPDLVVVSGLAYGIDVTAHTASLDSKLPTVAVVAHGLDRIYPADHRDVARSIVRNGGAIVTEYPFGVSAYRQHFLERNRIIAALSDITVVAETPLRGGSMSTANTAGLYSREVMALPGRATDENSAGCNMLIRTHKAHLIGCAADLVEISGWKVAGTPSSSLKRNLFPELDGEARIVYDVIRFSQEPLHVDRISVLTQLPVAGLMALLGEMEFDGIVMRHPGNRFSV